MKLRQLATNVSVFVVASLISFLLAEVAARIAFPHWAPRTARITQFWQHDESLGWAHIPGTAGRFSSFGFDVDVAINEHGFRGPLVPYERNCNRRIAILGDSFVWGYGVEYSDTFTARLEALDPSYEVVNLGVSGYSVDQELLLYRDQGYKYGADVVVVLVALNDFSNHHATEAYLVYGKPAFRLGPEGLTVVNQPVQPPSIAKRALVQIGWSSYIITQVYRVLEQMTAERRLQQPSPTAPSLPAQPPPEASFPRNPTQELAMALLEELNRLVTGNGSRLLVAFVEDVPFAGSAAEYLRARGIAAVPLTGHIAYPSAELHLPDELHWTPRGHEIVANVLANQLRTPPFKEEPMAACAGR